MRVVPDANILIRAALNVDGPARALLGEIRSRGHSLVLSDHILDVVDEKLALPRIQRRNKASRGEIEKFFQDLLEFSERVPPASGPAVVPNDPEDDVVVYTAVAGSADVICTLDAHFYQAEVLQFCHRRGIRLTRDTELLDSLRAPRVSPATSEPPFFEIEAECPHTRARAGVVHTPHGKIRTPIFMPVGTYGAVKGVTPKVLSEDLDAQIVLANTYHLYLRPGADLVAQLGGLHGFMSWDRPILTDSGGYQVFSLSEFRKIHQDGVTFRSHLDGSEHTFTPESTVDVQRKLGSDIMMVLDECPEYPVEGSYAREAMERTARWAATAIEHWRRSESGQALFPIVQGSMDVSLRRECATRLVELDAPGYAVGGLSVGEPRPLSYDMVEATEDILPRDKPRYVMGVGMLHELGEYVARGADMMDCVLPTRHARNGFFFTSEGRIIIKNSRYASDERPIDPSCKCYCCRQFSRAYLRHLFLAKEMLFSTLATIHNLHVYLDTMRRIRQAILIGELPGLLAQLRAADASGD